MTTNVGDVLSALEQIAPVALGESWDNNGLLLGRPDKPVQRVLLGTDFTTEIVNEAKALGAQVILTHHPVMLKGASRITPATPEGRAMLTALTADIAHIAAHTNWDAAVGGTNDTLGRLIGLTGARPLTAAFTDETLKLVVFVPEAAVATVRQAVCLAGAGHIGAYSECSFRTAGTGSFRGDATTHPTVGKREQLEEVPEWRLEVPLPARRLAAVIAALRASHPYEEPAFDIVPLRSVPTTREAPGMGRVGRLAQPAEVDTIIETLKTGLPCPTVAVVGPRQRTVQTVAVCTGSCGKTFQAAVSAGAELYLTGELRHHDAVDARALGLTVLAVGHFASERIAMVALAQRLAAHLTDVELTVSRVESDPFAYV